MDPDAAAIDHLGTLDSTDPIARIVDASVSPSGRYLVVLDATEPFVHVLDRAIDSTYSFGRKGEGPGEIKSPMGTTFSGDSLLLVLRSGGMDLFTPQGHFIDRIRSSSFGLSPQAVTDGCDGSVFLYGLNPEEPPADDMHWVHLIHDLGQPSVVQSYLPLPRGSGQRWGALEGFDGSSTEVLLWHRTNNTGSGWLFDCEEEEIHLLTEEISREEVRAALREDGARGMVFTLPDTMFSGAVIASHTPLVAHTVRAESGSYADGETLVRSWSSDGEGCVRLEGWWRVLDAASGVIALATSEPYPRALLVPSSLLAAPDLIGRPCGSE